MSETKTWHPVWDEKGTAWVKLYCCCPDVMGHEDQYILDEDRLNALQAAADREGKAVEMLREVATLGLHLSPANQRRMFAKIRALISAAEGGRG